MSITVPKKWIEGEGEDDSHTDRCSDKYNGCQRVSRKNQTYRLQKKIFHPIIKGLEKKGLKLVKTRR